MARQISINRNNLEGMIEFFRHVFTPLLIVCILILPNNFSTSAFLPCSKSASANLIFPKPPKGGFFSNQLIIAVGELFFR